MVIELLILKSDKDVVKEFILTHLMCFFFILYQQRHLTISHNHISHINLQRIGLLNVKIMKYNIFFMGLQVKLDQYSLICSFVKIVNQLKEINELAVLSEQLRLNVFSFWETYIIQKFLINHFRLVMSALLDNFD